MLLNPIRNINVYVSVIDNAKVQADMTDRRRFDEDVFRKAGTGRPKKTFKFDPTKPRV